MPGPEGDVSKRAAGASVTSGPCAMLSAREAEQRLHLGVNLYDSARPHRRCYQARVRPEFKRRGSGLEVDYMGRSSSLPLGLRLDSMVLPSEEERDRRTEALPPLPGFDVGGTQEVAVLTLAHLVGGNEPPVLRLDGRGLPTPFDPAQEPLCPRGGVGLFAGLGDPDISNDPLPGLAVHAGRPDHLPVGAVGLVPPPHKFLPNIHYLAASRRSAKQGESIRWRHTRSGQEPA